ncbi:MAG TPA: MotA/TolQ/ExbB proton channel family protein [Polyangia bacterium]|jgi:biopolymer transport protein ExbB/TolQ|nr:MotA/TolQ/ExbB proton channel family protein [Polyangia bacterium]
MQGLAEFFEHGGIFMYFNVVCSAVTIAIIVERTIFFLGKGSVNARAFLEQLRKLISANNVDRAVKLCSATEAPVARVAKAGLMRMSKGEAAVATGIEETMADVTPELKKRVAALWSVANIATLLGLLGTINGLIHSFAAVGSASPEQRSALLSKGIAEAMYNTAFGLGIAVTCMIGHVFLSAAAKKQASELETFSLKLENLLSENTPHSSGVQQGTGGR